MSLVTRVGLAGVVLCGVVWGQSATDTSLTASGNAALGSAVTITGSVVLHGTATPVTSGTVGFFNGAGFLGVATLNGSGQASFHTSLLPAGVASLRAIYQGNGSFAKSVSAASSLTVTSHSQSGLGAANIYNAYSVPDAIVTGDFNGDGIPDLAILNENGPNVTVLVGAAGGNFTEMTGSPFLVGQNPIAIATGDFNQDGKTDIVVANEASGNVSVLLSNGSGSFLGAAAYSTLGSGTAVAVADFNGDGIADLAVTLLNSSKISILLGTGTGSFGTASQINGSLSPNAIAVGDFNRDGNADLVTIGGGSSATVILGNGNGTFGTLATYSLGSVSGGNAIAVADFTNDGNPDIAVANSGNISVLVNNGSGIFTQMTGSPFSAGSSPKGIVAADFDGDGILDLATSNSTTNTISVLLGNGTTFSAPNTVPEAPASSPTALLAADLNGDGITDLAVTNIKNANTSGGVAQVAVLFGAATGGPVPTVTSLSTAATAGTYGVPLSLTATVLNSATAGDTVTFFATGQANPQASVVTTNLGSAPIIVAAGVASATLSATTIPVSINSQETLTATYNGGSAYGASTSTNLVQVSISSGSSTTSVVASPATVASNQPLTITATVTPGATGTVFFYKTNTNGSNFLGQGTLSGGNPNFVTLTVNNVLVAGSVPILAQYTGSSNLIGSISAAFTETVIAGTTTTLTSSANPANPNQQFTLTAGVQAGGSSFITGGTVNFLDGVTVLNTAPVTSGTATFQTSYSAAGSHSFTALFAGDATHGGSTSAALSQVIIGSTATTLSVTPSSPKFGQQATLTATITPAPPAGGIVAFYGGGKILGTGRTNAAGVATVPTTLLTVGPNKLSARYVGITGILGSASTLSTTTVTSKLQGGFGAAVTYPATGSLPNSYGTVLGDFNGDGFEDIAATTYTTAPSPTQGIEVFLGNGAGGFQAGQFYATTGKVATSGAIAVGDFNADGSQDIAVATGSGIEILLGDGTGAFPSVKLTAGTFTSLAVADFNQDGYPDLVVGAASAASTLLGNGDGTFAAATAVTHVTLSGTVFTVTTDLNNDGMADLVLVDTSANLNVALGNGDGTFQSPLVNNFGTTASAVAVGDLNNDGIPDLIVSTIYNGNPIVQISTGLGNGQFGGVPYVTVGSAPVSTLAIGDFTGDGVADIAAGDPAGGVFLIPNTGQAFFGTPVLYSTASAVTALLPGNFAGGDGQESLVVAYGAAGNIAVLPAVAASPVVSCFDTVTIFTTNTYTSSNCSTTKGVSPYTYSLGSGSLPPGSPVFAVNASTGVVTGTPTVGGTYTFTIAAADSQNPAQSGVSATQTLTVIPKLVLLSSLPNGSMNSPYTSQVIVAGGTAPYHCTNITGAPAGMSVDSTCALSGTPTQGGSFNIGFTASDSGIQVQTTSDFASLRIIGLPTSVVLTQASGANPSTFGAAIGYSAAVTPSNLAGTVTFYSNNSPLRTGTVSAGVASGSLTTLAVGTDTITAVFNPTDQNYAASAPSNALTEVVNQASPTITLTSSSPVPPVPGTSITFSARVANGSSGTVTFFDGAIQLGTPQTITPGVSATVTTSTLALGSHAITAAYSGNVSLLPKTSAVFEQGVFNQVFSDNFSGPANATWGNQIGAWSTSGGVYDATSPGSSPNAHTLLPLTETDFAVHVSTSTTTGDGGVWLRATDNPGVGIGVNGVYLAIQPAAGKLFFVSVQNGIATNGTMVALTTAAHTFDIVVIGSTYSVYVDGSATAARTSTITTFTSGQVGLYDNAALGFGHFILTSGPAAGSPSLTSTTTVLTASPSPATTGQSVALTATVTPASGSAVPTGNVTFLDGSTSLGTTAVNGSGVATLSASSLGAAVHSLTASYAGDSNFGVSVSAPVSETVSAPVTPPPPTVPVLAVTTSSLPDGKVGQAYGAGLSASGGTGAYSWSSVGGLPSGLTLSSSGTIGGTPGAAFTGSITVQVTAAGATATATLGLSIAAAPIVIAGNTSLGDIAAGGSVSAGFSASGGTPPYQWIVTGGAGLAVDGHGNVGGSIASAGTYSPTLSLTDQAGATATVQLTLNVLGISGSMPSGTTTSSYSGSVTGVGGLPPYSYTASGVPAGLTFSGGTLTGTPATAGNYSIGVRVTDSHGVSVSGSFSFTIAGAAPTTLTITTSGLQDGVVGQPYSQTLGAAGGVPGYKWTLTGGQLPAGLSLSPGGTISGTPTALGTASIGVQVSDTSGGQVLGAISLTIDPATLHIVAGGSFPSGMVGVSYPSQILTATGGIPPYTFSVKNGSTPAGLALAGSTLGGTPTAAGDFSFTLAVTDSAPTPASASVSVSGTIAPNAPGLILSSGGASFSMMSGATAVPSPASFSVSSSVTSDTLSFTASSTDAWLNAGGASGTPGNLTVGLNNNALALTPDGSPYSGTVTVTCTSPVCAGSTQTIGVSLAVTSPPPQLSVGSGLLSFVGAIGNPQASSAVLGIANAGGGSITINSVTPADSWLSVSSAPATLAPGPGASVTVTGDPSSLRAGFYTSSVTVNSSAGNATVPVTMLVSGASAMTLGPSGSQFSMSRGGAVGNSSGSFLVSVSGGATSYSATVQGGSWLTGGGAGSASSSAPGNVSFSINSAAAAALAPGSYYGTVQVSASGIVNSPQDYQIVLTVAPANTPAVPDPEPAGLVFLATAGASVPPQRIQVFASSTTPVAFQAGTDGSAWLSLSATSGVTSASAPGSVNTSVSTAGLLPGVYSGSVSFSFSGWGVRTVNVTLIVKASLVSATRAASASRAEASPAVCVGGKLVQTDTGIAGNFSTPVAWPTPLAIALYDTCGNAVANGQVTATFSNGDPSMTLTEVDPSRGIYSGTWTPRTAGSQVAISIQATAAGYSGAATTRISGEVLPNSAPSLVPNAIGDIFHPQVGAALAPGNIVQIYGSGLATKTSAASALPLPIDLAGTEVLIGGIAAPLYYASSGQINAQIPFELSPGSQYQVIVSSNGARTTPESIQLAPAAPAVLQSTSGAVIAEHQDGSLVLDSSPAVPGEYVVIFLTGLGATNSPVPSGAPSPSAPAASVVDSPSLTLNGAQVPVLFAGLTPTLAGLYQINFQVPASLADGKYTLVISEDGAASNQTVLTVKK